MPVKGIKRVKRNYAAKVKEISTKRTEGAMYAILSQGAAISQTMTPMDTGTLANSQYAPIIDMQAGKAIGYVGYQAEYAKWVHAMPGTLKGQPRADFGVTSDGVSFGGGTGTGNYWDPSGEPEWLTKGFDELKPAVGSILKAFYRV